LPGRRGATLIKGEGPPYTLPFASINAHKPVHISIYIMVHTSGVSAMLHMKT